MGQVLPFVRYTTFDGLVSNRILTLYQDRKGFLWIGTNNGVTVYDGVNYTCYSVVNGLSNNYITCFLESRREPGTMFIGTIAGGVNRFKNGSFTPMCCGSET